MWNDTWYNFFLDFYSWTSRFLKVLNFGFMGFFIPSPIELFESESGHCIAHILLYSRANHIAYLPLHCIYFRIIFLSIIFYHYRFEYYPCQTVSIKRKWGSRPNLMKALKRDKRTLYCIFSSFCYKVDHQCC